MDKAQDAHEPRIPVDAFYPLTMPLTVGPGSIALAVTLGSQRPRATDMAELALLGGAAVVGLIAMAVTIYVSYRLPKKSLVRSASTAPTCWCDCRLLFCSASASRLYGAVTATLSGHWLIAKLIVASSRRLITGRPFTRTGSDGNPREVKP
jgi:hypothetical protein